MKKLLAIALMWLLAQTVFAQLPISVRTTNGVSYNELLRDSSGVTSIQPGIRFLEDSTAQFSLDWNNRVLRDSTGSGSLDWNNRQLIGAWTLPTASLQLQNIGGAPERGWVTVAPTANTVLGYSANSAVEALYFSQGTSVGQWNGSFMFNGAQQWGTATNMVAGSTSHVIWVNGAPTYQSTNGATGPENGLSLRSPDPKQGLYLTFSAPTSGNGPLGTPGGVVMSPDSDVQIGLGGWAYGTNTLVGVGIANDLIMPALNPGHDLFMTTTENQGAFGCREFLSYDAANSIWRWPKDVSGNGTFKNAGYTALIAIDEKAQTMTNYGGTYLHGTTIADGATITLAGTGITIGNGGTGNLGNGSFGQFALNTAGTPGAPDFLFKGGGNMYLNFDGSGNEELGIFHDGTINDYMVILTNTHSQVWINTNVMLMGGINTPFTLTGSGQTGNKTINKISGSVRIAAAGTTVTVTDSFVTANSVVVVDMATADTTGRVTSVVPTSGQFVINTVAVTAETEFRFVVFNQ